MIKELIIENYQSHKKTITKFCKGVNIFVGPSDAGKSAIIRALDWCINDKPKGVENRSDWGGDTSVSLTNYDNTKVIRFRSDKENLYLLQTDQDEVKYGNFSNNIPKEVREILNFSEVNFQSQHDKHFMLSSTSGEVARFINQTVNLDIIDKTLSSIDSSKRTLSKDLKYSLSSLEKSMEEIEKFDDLPELLKLVEEAEELEDQIGKLDDSKELLEDLITGINYYQTEIGKVPDVTGQEKEVNDALLLVQEIKELEDEVVNIGEAIEYIGEAKRRIKVKKAKITKMEAEYKELMGDTCPLCNSKIRK
jgi:exonuclease SbcC